MSVRKSTLAGSATVALVAGATVGAAGAAAAQDEDPQTGSLGSSSLDFGEIAADLELAAAALNGPVSVSGNAAGGPTVTYTNPSDVDKRCIGFTMPYTTVVDEDIDPGGIGGDILAAYPVIMAIEGAGNVSILDSTEEGAPTAYDSEPGGGLGDPDARGVIQAVLGLLEPTVESGVTVAPGDTITWTATAPTTPAAAVTLCVPPAGDTLFDIDFGVDPQVVADQINDRIPGGSIEPVSAGSVSGGSVEAGAAALGSLAAADPDE